MKHKYIYWLIVLIINLFLPYISYAGSAKLNIIHINPVQKAVKFEVRYGSEKKDDPTAYTQYTIVIPKVPSVGQTSCDVKIEGSGLFYVSVKDYYEDGTTSDFSEPFLLNVIPKKIANPVIKTVGN